MYPFTFPTASNPYDMLTSQHIPGVGNLRVPGASTQNKNRTVRLIPSFTSSGREDLAPYARDGISAELMSLTWEMHNPKRTYPAVKIAILNGSVFVAGDGATVANAVQPWRAPLRPRAPAAPPLPPRCSPCLHSSCFSPHASNVCGFSVVPLSHVLPLFSFLFPLPFRRFARELLVYVLVIRDLALTFKLPDVEVGRPSTPPPLCPSRPLASAPPGTGPRPAGPMACLLGKRRVRRGRATRVQRRSAAAHGLRSHPR